ncbi:ATP-binding protein [Solimonas marina]|uniref:histidine kinase n=1 Tax=Solimonas marina TaxID=2714601 RepID=A0A969WCL1_9GAMM|nr:ATP-binding protein [Solimonas marina]NKF23734.1 GAF domain-containing protein [Solimonas marina]
MAHETSVPSTLLADCDREPIHIPGAIQPQGVLLCLREPELTIAQASANLQQLTGQPAEQALDQPLAAVCGEDAAAMLRRALASAAVDARPLYVGLIGIGGHGVDAIVHRHEGVLILELEFTTREDANRYTAMYPLVRSFVASLQSVHSVPELCQLAAGEMQRITGFGRVLVYRFNEDGHGHVIAETRAPEYPSYLDLYFPESDIPRQARALYQLNHIRLIADAEYQPSPLVPAVNPMTQRSTDLSYAALRSVSPVHVQYMKNMGTLASMSISIVVDGALWGLISCHHATARHVPFELRTACEHLGQILSLQIEAKEDRTESAHRLELRRMLVDLLGAMAETDVINGLKANPADLLRFAAASGAAIVADGGCELFGDTPSAAEVTRLADWIAAHTTSGVYATTSLAGDYPDAEHLQPQVAGVLAASISQIHRNYLIWFRPEVVRTVKWAGRPQKTAGEGDDAPVVLHPRSSFDAWAQTVRGSSLPWRKSEIEAAEEFRDAILAIVLRRAEEMAALAGELERSNRELEAFSYSVSHDLRAPLRHIVGYADLLDEFEGAQLSERGRRFLRNIGESAHFAGTLVDDLLTFSQMGRAALRITRVDLNALVESVLRDLAPDLRGRDIQWKIGTLPTVRADPSFLLLALRNLLSNAIKYTRTRQTAEIQLEAEEDADSHIVHVRDNGVGFNMQYAPKLFGVFQRLHRMEDFEGTGIGLANVRRIIERHDGRVWARGEPDRGAEFSFSLPKIPVPVS